MLIGSFEHAVLNLHTELLNEAVGLLKEIRMSTINSAVSLTQLQTDVQTLVNLVGAFNTAYQQLQGVIANETISPAGQSTVNAIDATIQTALAANPVPSTAVSTSTSTS